MRLTDFLGIDVVNEEESNINFVEEFLNKGRANEKGVTVKDVDPKQLEKGIEVEYEHTSNKAVARRIALDHLAELPDYYTRLKKMEEDGMKELGIEAD